MPHSAAFFIGGIVAALVAARIAGDFAAFAVLVVAVGGTFLAINREIAERVNAPSEEAGAADRR